MAGAAGTGNGAAGMGGVSGAGGTAGAAGSGGSGGNGSCTVGMFAGHVYAFCGVVENAMAAFNKCAGLGLQMVSIESRMENEYVQSKQTSTWLGGSDEPQEGEWRWVSTNALFWSGDHRVEGAYQNFMDGQPNDHDDQGLPEDCLVMTANGWNDVVCTKTGFKATCESIGLVLPPGGFPPGSP